jgi:hypothetical protein
VRHPGVAGIHVVLDQQERAVPFQERADVAKDLFLFPVKMKRVCHQDAIQRRQGQRAREIGADRVDVLGGPKARPMGLFQFAKPAAVPVNGVYLGIQPDQFAQRKRERAASGTEVCPCAALGQVRRAQ